MKNNNFELVIFGSGYGECILVKLKNDYWAVIDSLLDYNKEPIAYSYLKKLGLIPEKVIKLIIASHFHDDHIKGMAKLIKKCVNSDFALSASLSTEDFFIIIELKNHDRAPTKSGINELNEIIQTLNSRKKSPIWCLQNKYLHEKYLPSDISLEALSPSDKTYINFLGDIRKIINSAILTPQSPNNYSVVLKLKIKNLNILLGSDLEITKDDKTGWTAVINSKNFMNEKSQIYKIPHHGSKTADKEEIWNILLNNPIGIVTAFNRGKKKLPSEDDLKRLNNNCQQLYYTSLPKNKKPNRRDNPAERQLNLISKNRKIIESKCNNYIRFTCNGKKKIKIQTFGEAKLYTTEQ